MSKRAKKSGPRTMTEIHEWLRENVFRNKCSDRSSIDSDQLASSFDQPQHGYSADESTVDQDDTKAKAKRLKVMTVTLIVAKNKLTTRTGKLRSTVASGRPTILT